MYQIYMWLKNKIFPSTIPQQYKVGEYIYCYKNKWVITKIKQWGFSYDQDLELSSLSGRIKLYTNNHDDLLKPIEKVYF